jgi:hypothetical protein
MFLRNATSLDVTLARSDVSDELAVAAVLVAATYAVTGDGLAAVTASPRPCEGDPPDITGFALWDGVSVTAAGAALGPAKPPFVRPVLFRIGAVERRLVVFGDRRWERRLGGEISASAPAPFDRIDLSFKRAFGGGYDLPPGLVPGTDLPHPGMRVIYPLNEQGMGYYPDEHVAMGAPLPNIERPDQLVRRWNDTPEPAGFTPCPDLGALRLRYEAMARGRGNLETDDVVENLPSVVAALRVHHYAPPLLIFQSLLGGTPIELDGLGTGPIRFVVPLSPATVVVQVGKNKTAVRSRLRALHADAERRIVRIIFEHGFRYDPRRAPSWIRVAAASGGTS